jgi:hypothetical protein
VSTKPGQQSDQPMQMYNYASLSMANISIENSLHCDKPNRYDFLIHVFPLYPVKCARKYTQVRFTVTGLTNVRPFQFPLTILRIWFTYLIQIFLSVFSPVWSPIWKIRQLLMRCIYTLLSRDIEDWLNQESAWYDFKFQECLNYPRLRRHASLMLNYLYKNGQSND